MPVNKYLKLTIGDKQVQVTNPEDLPISIDYSLEDPDNFQDKPSAQSLALKIPATLMNDVAGNTFRNPDIIDLTAGEIFRGNQQFTIDENGFEIMTGKAFLNQATHNVQPIDYEYDLFGDNADWKIDLEEATLFDFVSRINFTFSKSAIVDSWAFTGNNEAMPYVFAPVRYRGPMGGYSIDANNQNVGDDTNMLPTSMKPALSKYWILFWALKSVGYRIESNFLSSQYFRRQVMPWSWGSFLSSEGTRFDLHRFRAKSVLDNYNKSGGSTSNSGDRYVWWDLQVTNDSTDGMFDNNNDYSYLSGNQEMRWTYNSPSYGTLEATYSIILNVDALAGSNSDVGLQVHWYKNGTEIKVEQLVALSAPYVTVSPQHDIGQKTSFFTATVNPGDTISARIKVRVFQSKLGSAYVTANVAQFQLDYFKVPIGGTIDFQNYLGFKNYKFLDFLRGVIDEFNLSINTDSVNKVVVIEPTHQYSITDDLTAMNPGYFIDDFIDWNQKKDLSKDWVMQNYNDYNRELTFKYRNDTNDGILKVVQDRNINVLGAGKYVFPDRFKTGKTDIENRFFSATMHYEADQWKAITGVSPQLVCMIPENISNTSNSEAANTFLPKSCYYKGLTSGVGGWRFDGETKTELPFMFAVNYKDGGQNDPVLSYSDEKIANGTGFVIAKGLLKRFYWQRLAIMRNGQWYNTWFRLKNVDVTGQLHREYKSFGGHRWELIKMTGYRPLQELSTACLLRRWAAVSLEDFNNTFPSEANVLTNNGTNSLDIKYAQLKGLITDIPNI
jgi:hypothetical protein